MRVAVTGGAGKLGREVVAHLASAGHEAVSIDRASSTADIRGDLRQIDFVRSAVAGANAIVHLAAWPTPHAAPAAEVFSDNVVMASNVLHVAADMGIRRVVAASSQSVLGLPWSPQVTEPDYLPVDEAHPCRPTDGYSLSKLVTEQVARLLAERGEIDARVLRFPVIWEADNFDACIAGRTSNPAQGAKSQWAYVDVRDAARAVRLALEFDRPGYEVLNVTAPVVFATRPTAELVAEWYPNLAASEAAPAGKGACFDWRAAHERLGFVCRYIWTVEGIEEVSLPD